MTETAEASSRIITEQRRHLIARMVEEQGSVSTDVLVQRFGVSSMTVYRDLKALEHAGALRSVRGGAIRTDTAAEPQLEGKRLLNRDRKEAIARHAARRFVDPADIVILEAGSTVAAMVRHLDQDGLTLITNGLDTVNEARVHLPGTAVMCCGGMLRDVAHTFVGPHAERFFREVHARTLFLGGTGLTLPEGVTDLNPLEIEVKRAMADSAERVVLLMDSTKFGRRSLSPILPLERIQTIVTDDGAPAAVVDALRDAGVDVHVVPVA